MYLSLCLLRKMESFQEQLKIKMGFSSIIECLCKQDQKSPDTIEGKTFRSDNQSFNIPYNWYLSILFPPVS